MTTTIAPAPATSSGTTSSGTTSSGTTSSGATSSGTGSLRMALLAVAIVALVAAAFMVGRITDPTGAAPRASVTSSTPVVRPAPGHCGLPGVPC